MNITGDLKPWKNMTKTIDFKPKQVLDINARGTAIIWETEE